MSSENGTHRAIPFSMGMVLVTMGVVYGDIGTSPMYTLRAIMHGNGSGNIGPSDAEGEAWVNEEKIE